MLKGYNAKEVFIDIINSTLFIDIRLKENDIYIYDPDFTKLKLGYFSYLIDTYENVYIRIHEGSIVISENGYGF